MYMLQHGSLFVTSFVFLMVRVKKSSSLIGDGPPVVPCDALVQILTRSGIGVRRTPASVCASVCLRASAGTVVQGQRRLVKQWHLRRPSRRHDGPVRRVPVHVAGRRARRVRSERVRVAESPTRSERQSACRGQRCASGRRRAWAVVVHQTCESDVKSRGADGVPQVLRVGVFGGEPACSSPPWARPW